MAMMSTVLLVAALLLTATGEDSGRSVGIEVGDRIVVILDANPTTGYSWQLAAGLDQAIVTHVTREYAQQGAPAPGVGGAETWTFEATSPGSTSITLDYLRPWEPENVARQFTLVVNVAPGSG
jgi:inhibitor of cysteine peptidase